ncbi:recombinase [Neisseria sp. Dent CA1/247]|uniref:site-specific recombinase n=1 Tax=Neisseria sp. Dent CA1/247 TaxID=2912675 RepID=UPI001FD0174B|nr:recombinase [Neisseria sp. Dent CA1/247]UOO75912.1 recombinase [Neisseria sp. Dent CA1/247]
MTSKHIQSAIHIILNKHIDNADFVDTLDALINFVRKGGAKRASDRFDALLAVLQEDQALCTKLSRRFYTWLSKVHIYPALVGLGIFSRSGFARELGLRLYERFSPSYKDLNNLRDVFLYLFHSKNDGKWLQTLTVRQWLKLHSLINEQADKALVQNVLRQLSAARLHALEMLSVWVAAEALEPDLIRIEPRLLDVNSAFVALQRETSKLAEHYQTQTTPYDTAHIEVMLDQCLSQVERLRRKGTGAGSGSSVKVAHLLERLSQTIERLSLLLRIQTGEHHKHAVVCLLKSMTSAAVEQRSTDQLWRRSVKMLATSISENKSHHGEHYITRSRKEYFSMLWSAAGGGVLISLMALIKIHIGHMGFGVFTTSLLSGLNYGFGFMLIHMLGFTVATKQPAMTAASFAEQVAHTEKSRSSVETKLGALLIDVVRSQSVAVFGNVCLAILVAALIAFTFASNTGEPLLDAHSVAYQLKSVQVFTQPTLWYAAIAGVWLFCSGIIAGFFDNRADYLDLRRRLTVNPLLKKILSPQARKWVGDYFHNNYGSLMGNFIFGMLLGMTGYFGYLLNLPLDIRHVAFSSANLGYAAVSGHIGFISFMINLSFVMLIGLVNLIVSFALALLVALRARDTHIDSVPKLLKNTWQQIKANPLNLFFPVQPIADIVKGNGKSEHK